MYHHEIFIEELLYSETSINISGQPRDFPKCPLNPIQIGLFSDIPGDQGGGGGGGGAPEAPLFKSKNMKTTALKLRGCIVRLRLFPLRSAS